MARPRISASAAPRSRRPIELDAGLQELAGLARAQAEDRPEIAVAGRCAAALGEVPAADRDGVIGAQAQFVTVGVLRHEQAAADVLAGQVDEDVARLQDGRLDTHVAVALEERDQPVDRLCETRHGSIPAISLAAAKASRDRFRPKQ